MKWRPPDQVRIGPHRFTVEIEPTKFRDDDSDYWLAGQCNHSENRIRIAERASSRMFETFIHECLHGMSNVADVDLSEDDVTRLSPVLASFLIDNGYVDED